MNAPHKESNGTLAGGAAAGLIAGLLFGLAGMQASFAIGSGFWSNLQLFAGTFYGVESMIEGAPAAFLGGAALLGVSALYGIVFAASVRPDTNTGAALWGGLIYAVCIWAIRTFVTLPFVNAMMAERMALTPGIWFVQHLIFGAALTLTPTLKGYYSVRAVSRGAQRKEPVHL